MAFMPYLKSEDMEGFHWQNMQWFCLVSERWLLTQTTKYVPNYSMDGELLEKVEYWVEANHAEQSFIWDRFPT